MKYSVGTVTVTLKKEDSFAVIKLGNPVDSLTDSEFVTIEEKVSV